MANRQSAEQLTIGMKKADSMGKIADASWVGELMRTPGPSPGHQLIVQNMMRCLLTEIGDKYVVLQAPCDLQLSAYKFRQPDLMLISIERSHIIEEHAVTSPPDMVAEVLSHSSRPLDCSVKMKEYAAFGIREYWLIDPEKRQIEQYVLRSDMAGYDLKQVFKENDNVCILECTKKLFATSELFAASRAYLKK